MLWVGVFQEHNDSNAYHEDNVNGYYFVYSISKFHGNLFLAFRILEGYDQYCYMQQDKFPLFRGYKNKLKNWASISCSRHDQHACGNAILLSNPGQTC